MVTLNIKSFGHDLGNDEGSDQLRADHRSEQDAGLCTDCTMVSAQALFRIAGLLGGAVSDPGGTDHTRWYHWYAVPRSTGTTIISIITTNTRYL